MLIDALSMTEPNMTSPVFYAFSLSILITIHTLRLKNARKIVHIFLPFSLSICFGCSETQTNVGVGNKKINFLP